MFYCCKFNKIMLFKEVPENSRKEHGELAENL
jgi:hypothetical protein